METITPAREHGTGTEIQRLESRNRTLFILVVVLAIVAVAAGAFLLYEALGTDSTDVPTAVEAVFDDYIEAWNSYDGDALLAVTTEDFEFYEAESLTAPMTLHSRTGTVQIVEEVTAAESWSVEMIGPPLAVGEDTITLVTADRIDTATETSEGVSIYTIVQSGDEWKIDQHVFLYADQ
ncbi:MAG TPA: nuclear transport factor 2 family protein [Acidimicrobiia bacterium]|nr:nuclear transport factor 2 family protein [Acidimicrobiia bacterium]